MLMKIYSPDGEMFEVMPARAKYLSLTLGWTFSAQPSPVFKETAKTIAIDPKPSFGVKEVVTGPSNATTTVKAASAKA